MSGSAKSRNHRREAYRRAVNLVYEFLARSSAARARGCVFSLDNRLTWTSVIQNRRSSGSRNELSEAVNVQAALPLLSPRPIIPI